MDNMTNVEEFIGEPVTPEPVVEPEKEQRWWVQLLAGVVAALVVASVVLAASALALRGTAQDLRNDQKVVITTEESSREEIYKNRAVSCRVLVAQGVELKDDGPCMEPGVLAYYDPAAAPIAPTVHDLAALTQIGCLLLAQGEYIIPECLDAGFVPPAPEETP